MEKTIVIPPSYIDHIASNYGKILSIESLDVAYTNKVFKFTTSSKTLLLKLLTKEKNILFNKKNEIKLIESFSKLGFTPPLLEYRLPRYMIFEYIPHSKANFENSKTLTLKEEHLISLVNYLKIIHNSNIAINTINYEKVANIYIKKIRKEIKNSATFLQILFFFNTTLTDVKKLPPLLGVCHGDLNPNNFMIDNNDKLLLVDFEYAYICDIYFDFAALKSTLCNKDFKTFCKLYFENTPNTFDEKKLILYRNFLDLLSILWFYAFSYDKIAEDIFYNYKLRNNLL